MNQNGKSFGSITVLRKVVEARAETAKKLLEQFNECDCGELVEKPAVRCEECDETYVSTAHHIRQTAILFN